MLFKKKAFAFVSIPLKKSVTHFRFILLLSFLSLPGLLQAQNAPVVNTVLTGVVTDSATGSPLSSVSVQIKGITNGTTTNQKGEFSLSTAQKLPFTITVGYVGYETKDVIASGNNVQIVLKETANQLTEVVAVGYGTQRKSDVTGSVASIPKAAMKQQVTSFERFLQGSVSGVQVTQASGQPGAAVSIRVRGGNSITAGNEPLYVIDGFPVYNNNADASAGVASGPSINGLSAINPSDIESIDILKDASATAIYGSRGANGVVLITTKKGKAGKNTVMYDGSYGFQQVSKTVDVLTDSKQWALLKNDARINAGKTPYYTQEGLDTLTGGTDWQDAAFRNAPMQNHQLTFMGGDEKFHFSLSGNYLKQDGILINTDFERYSGRINLDYQMSDKFKIGSNITASKTNSQIAEDNIVSSLLLMPPTVKIKDVNGNYTYQSAFETPLGNPIATLLKETNQSNTMRFLGNVYGEYKLLKGLTARVSMGADLLSNKENRYLPKTIYQGANTNTTGTGAVGNRTYSSWLNENTLTYSTTFKNNNTLNAVAGFTQQAFRSEYVIAGSQGFTSELLTYNDLGSGAVYTRPASGTTYWALNSFLGRVNYGIANKYLFTISARADGSSRFGVNNRWGYFPSAAFAWNLSKEEFLHLPSVINNLKLRLSAGITGNQEIGLYQALPALASNTYYFGGIAKVGYYPTRIQNNDLGWESTAQYDAGFDLSLLNSRITITFDAYYKKTTDLLLDVPLPYTTGQISALQNYGTVSNKGLELAINTQNIQGKFNWSTGLVLSTNQNKVLSLGNGVQNIISGVSIAQVGEPLGSFYGFKTNGIFQTTDDITKLPVYLTKNKPGDQRYVDKNGDNVITTTSDRYIIGNSQPKLIGGLSNSFTYAGFDLNVLLQGSYGNKVFNQNKQQLEIFSGQQNVSVTALDRWTPENPSTTIPRAYEDPAAVASNRFVEDASYLRIKNLALGYTTPLGSSGSLKNIKIRIYVSAQNLVTWTKYTGYDPEVSRNEQTTLTQGIDYSVYPNARLYTGGINITF